MGEKINYNLFVNSFLLPQSKKDAYDVTKKIDTYLRFLSLSGIRKTESGKLVKADNTVQYVIFTTFALLLFCACMTGRFFFTYWMNEWSQRAYTECLLSVLSAIFVLSLFAESYSADLPVYIEYYTNYRIIDAILGRDNDESYNKETKEMTRIFFVVVSVYTVKVIIEPMLFCVSYALIEVLPFFNDYIFNYFQSLTILYIFVKITMLEKRMLAFEKRIVGMITLYKLNLNAEVRKLKRCYFLFHRQCFLLNRIHGWQELLECIFILMCVTRMIFSVAISDFTSYKLGTFIGFALVRLLADGGIVVCLVTAIEKVMADRNRCLMLIEQALVEKDLDFEGEEQLRSLLEVIYRQPLVFTASNFFTIDYTLLQSMFSAAVSYIIILTQMK